MNPTTERILRDLLRLGALVEDLDKSPTPAASVPLTNAVMAAAIAVHSLHKEVERLAAEVERLKAAS